MPFVSTMPTTNNSNLIDYQVNQHTATITLNDPKSLNALSSDLATDLIRALIQADEDPNIRAIVLTGANNHFSSGGHIKEMLSVGMDRQALSDKLRQMVLAASDIIRKIRDVQKPIIAKLQGTAAGAGFNLALACDFRIANNTARFIQSFIHIGLVPDAGGLYLLSQLVGVAKATELTMLGSPITAQQAHDLGLLTKLVDNEQLDMATDTLAKQLVKLPNQALATIKQMTNATVYAGLSEAMDMEVQHQAMLAKSDDFIEGVSAFIEKRQANFMQS